MNLFILHEDPIKAAQLNCDSHTRKIILEASEMMGYAFISQNIPYPLEWVKKGRHFNHPMSKAVRNGKINFEWTLKYLEGLLQEFEYRFNKKHAYHKLPDEIKSNKLPTFISNYVEWPRCFGVFKQMVNTTNSIVTDYRNYYVVGKQHLRVYTKRRIPAWFVKFKQTV